MGADPGRDPGQPGVEQLEAVGRPGAGGRAIGVEDQDANFSSASASLVSQRFFSSAPRS